MPRPELRRCVWPGDDPLMQRYHDREWGVPVHHDRKHFEYLVLDAAQAGLSWRTVLYKRQAYRSAFDRFDFRKVAAYRRPDIQRLLKDPGIIRNRQKIKAAVVNAKAFLGIRKEFGTFDRYIWRFANPRTRRHAPTRDQDIPARTKESDAMSEDLRRRGFSFVGSTICYAYMQAAGMVNDHLVTCFRREPLLQGRSVDWPRTNL